MSFIKELYKKNAERQIEWDTSDEIDELFKTVEFVGEVGELCNNIKKIKREQLGLAGSRCTQADLKSEFGDVMITLALLADYMNVDLEQVVKEKFNSTSEKMGFKTKFENIHVFKVTIKIPRDGGISIGYCCINRQFSSVDDLINYIQTNAGIPNNKLDDNAQNYISENIQKKNKEFIIPNEVPIMIGNKIAMAYSTIMIEYN